MTGMVILGVRLTEGMFITPGLEPLAVGVRTVGSCRCL